MLAIPFLLLLPAQGLELSDAEFRGERVRVGHLEVFENRAAARGRKLRLRVVVVPARDAERRRPDPIFELAGGPGMAATSLVGQAIDSPFRDTRDIVLVDQRGTNEEHRIDVPVGGSEDDPAGYLGPLFPLAKIRAALPALEERFDLTQYSTANAMDDLDDVRRALGYEEINLVGGSYGTRAALVYMRRHTASVRTAILTGVAPLGMKNPLTHARQAQLALDALFAECAADPSCTRAFPNPAQELDVVLERLAEEPVGVTLHADGEELAATLTRESFAEALRVLLYTSPGNKRVPLLIRRAFEGDLVPFAEAGFAVNRRLRQMLAFGMLLCVTCAEDLDRITDDEIEPATRGTFLGPERVLAQQAACAFWPRSELPADFGAPAAVEVPTLILTGRLDPVTGPELGAEAARHLPAAIHVVHPGAHDAASAPCLVELQQRFLETGGRGELDLSCVEMLVAAPFVLPE